MPHSSRDSLFLILSPPRLARAVARDPDQPSVPARPSVQRGHRPLRRRRPRNQRHRRKAVSARRQQPADPDEGLDKDRIVGSGTASSAAWAQRRIPMHRRHREGRRRRRSSSKNSMFQYRRSDPHLRTSATRTLIFLQQPTSADRRWCRSANISFSDSPPDLQGDQFVAGSKALPGERLRSPIGRAVREHRRWLIGGDQDEDASFPSPAHARLAQHLDLVEDAAVRGNTTSTRDIPSFRYSQVHTLQGAGSTSLDLVVRAQRRRSATAGGSSAASSSEFRYNLVLDADAHNFIVGPRAHAYPQQHLRAAAPSIPT